MAKLTFLYFSKKATLWWTFKTSHLQLILQTSGPVTSWNGKKHRRFPDFLLNRQHSVWFRSTPHPGCQSPPGWHYIFRLGNPYKPSFATVTGWGIDPEYDGLFLTKGALFLHQPGAPWNLANLLEICHWADVFLEICRIKIRNNSWRRAGGYGWI